MPKIAQVRGYVVPGHSIVLDMAMIRGLRGIQKEVAEALGMGFGEYGVTIGEEGPAFLHRFQALLDAMPPEGE